MTKKYRKLTKKQKKNKTNQKKYKDRPGFKFDR